MNVLPDASRYGWLSTGTDNPGMLWGFSHCQAGEGEVKETSFKDSLAAGNDAAQSPLRLRHFLPVAKALSIFPS